jgi:adenine-specific DNA-methyltransferase
MKIPERLKHEGLVEYAERLSELYARTADTKVRKLKGQFFTPKEVGTFMASLFEIQHTTLRLLDPGAGTGILTAAFCERILNNSRSVNLTIHAYENDPRLLPLLETALEQCKADLKVRGHNIEYNIYEQDFILHNQGHLRQSDLFGTSKQHASYDFIVSNPPYYKLSKDSPQSSVMMELISGQPNIYALFMALSASMLRHDGEMVFITPRSFCSGLYYKKFREWFLKNLRLTHVHIFESRKEIFDRDGVLQENIIIKAIKPKKISNHKRLIISSSENKSFTKLKKLSVRYTDVVHYKNGDVFIRIPTSTLDIDILHVVDRWPNVLRNLGLEISTGPVVPFRATQYLLPELTESPKSAPLLWMHNMQGMRVVWPLKKNKKPLAIRVSDETSPLVLPVKNYVLLKRFSSKEQKRRLYAAVLLESEFPQKTVGIENHVNYIHKPKGNLSVNEAFGIAAILNTFIIDNYFRSLNGNTQVNATDIRSLPFPKIDDIREIGKLISRPGFHQTAPDLDDIAAKALKIKIEEIKNSTKGETINE